jgi:hypothetical protein
MAAIPLLPTLGPSAGLVIGGILIVAGLLLGFWGHGVWATVMSMIGALLGSAVGFLVGTALGNELAGLVLAAVGAIIGSILFSKLVKVALAFLVGLLAGALTYSLLHGSGTFTPGAMDTALIVSIVVVVIVFGVAFYYIDDLIGIITAAIGGLLVAAGLYILNISTLVAAAAGIGVFLLGAFVQTTAINR